MCGAPNGPKRPPQLLTLGWRDLSGISHTLSLSHERERERENERRERERQIDRKGEEEEEKRVIRKRWERQR